MEEEADRFEKEQNKLNECMDLHKEILTIKRNSYGEHSEEYHRTSYKLC